MEVSWPYYSLAWPYYPYYIPIPPVWLWCVVVVVVQAQLFLGRAARELYISEVHITPNARKMVHRCQGPPRMPTLDILGHTEG